MHRLIALFTSLLLCLTPFTSWAEGTDAESEVLEVREKNTALRLLSELYAGENTLVFSPVSLSIALDIAAKGADGETAVQLNRFLGEKRPGAHVLEDLAFSGAELANAAFVSSDLTLLPDYKNALYDSYGIEPTVMETGNVMDQVNEWICSQTNGQIDGLLSAEPAENNVLLLISTLYMKADWVSPFNPANTLPSVFHAPEGDIEVSSMNQENMFAYGEKDGVQSILLPYADSSLAMLILLPEEGSIETLIHSLSDSPDLFIQKYLPVEEAYVQLSLPNVRCDSEFELKDALIRMGVVDPFGSSTANFSQMSQQDDLYIASVTQKTILTVNESGTEAAAATQVAMNSRGAYHDQIACMNVDRPFMMLVYDQVSGYVLFVSCVNNPA